ncbi:hypothetical protein G8764_17035 [Pseudomaricurvus alcaniphilus]|uniref:cytochrome C oxidase subunit IV family protein n=1 Tax=Pseudomaricurvus alcaniphilus TaxID=1166482 RepID=UPI00140AC1C6|nr:cytochrome C oxidase subunit IV family protein [Pseudomaricurvus alcaniphilus]NHN39017.1 hypothetical protein [Pseudomaricurvus alcaniphilus]
MKAYLLHRNSIVLAVLVVLTLISWYLGLDQVSVEQVSTWSGVTMLLLAFVKVRLVISNFMEVRAAPLPLKLCCDAWVVVASLLTISAYLGAFS